MSELAPALEDHSPASELSHFPRNVIVLDTETTGLDYKTEKLIEIAAVKLIDGEVTETFSSLVNPEKVIRHSSFLIHNISDEMVQDAPTIANVLPRFMEFMGDYAYVAHNAIFDYSFINEASKALYGQRFTNQRIDTFEMYRAVFPDENSHGLNALLHRFGYTDEVVLHRALDDAMCLAKVFPRLRDLYEQKFAWRLSQLPHVPYLVERYLRIQKASNALQAEMSDLKDIFKLYFQNGGTPIEASTGEVLSSHYRRNYLYDEKKVWEIALQSNIQGQMFKLNPRALEKVIDRSELEDSVKEALRECRLSMHENRSVNFAKASSADAPAIVAGAVVTAKPEAASTEEESSEA
jgi:DNA polymerase III epsilon subunit family exonuclease